MSKTILSEIDKEMIWGNTPTATLNDQLENFFEVNEVGMDAVSYLKDEEMTEVSLYDLLGWYTIDSFFSVPALGRKAEAAVQPQALTEDYDFIRSIYWSWGGSFRYDVPV
ncbi:MAG: hypothetical protein JXC33_01960 [Deltaproteobacteria bacterium]|nr:hypothetical protein [Deltaproteobacteria bacterium]